MSLYKQKGSDFWYVSITQPNGGRVRQSAGTTDKKEAQEYHDKLKHEMWRVSRMGDTPDYTWDKALDQYLEEKEDKRTINQDAAMLNWSLPHLQGKSLSGLTNDTWEYLIKKRREGQREHTKGGTSNATINRYMSAIQRVMNAAVKRGWVSGYPPIRKLPEPKGRLRFLSKEEAVRLLSFLPAHMRAMAEFTLCTGLRENNVLELEWSQVDTGRQIAWIHADQFKQGRNYTCHLNDRAVEILNERRKLKERFVFTYDGGPLGKASNHSWYRALKKAELEGFTWHGLRHTWASWHVINGTPLRVLMDLGGWADYDSVLRYAHLAPGHVAQYANNAKAPS